jgi:hypothetical protein
MLGLTSAGHGQLQASEEEAVQRCAASSRYFAGALGRLGRQTASAEEAGLLLVAEALRYTMMHHWMCRDIRRGRPRPDQGPAAPAKKRTRFEPSKKSAESNTALASN